MTEGDAGIGIDPNASRIGPAMSERRRHGPRQRLELLGS